MGSLDFFFWNSVWSNQDVRRNPLCNMQTTHPFQEAVIQRKIVTYAVLPSLPTFRISWSVVGKFCIYELKESILLGILIEFIVNSSIRILSVNVERSNQNIKAFKKSLWLRRWLFYLWEILKYDEGKGQANRVTVPRCAGDVLMRRYDSETAANAAHRRWWRHTVVLIASLGKCFYIGGKLNNKKSFDEDADWN